jgi:hypothetical protein
MDEKWVEEYVDRQVDLGARQAKKGLRDLKDLSLMNLIDWEFRTPYSNCLFDMPISVQMPFFEQLIMTLRPYHTENDFEVAYGLSVQAVLDLWRQKRLLVTAVDPIRYVGLDYLDPILENEPPYLEMAAEVFFRGTSNLMGGEEYFDSCYEVALAKIRSSRSIMEAVPDKMPRLAYRTMTKDDFLSTFATAYATLCGFGYEELATGLLSNANFVSLESMVKFNELLIFYPRYKALDGIVTLDPSNFQLATQLGLPTNTQPFPVEVAKLLARKLPILTIKDVGWEDVVELRGKTAELRKLLFELDRYASSGEFEKLPREDALEKAFEEARLASAEIAKARKLSTLTINASLGVLGGAAGVALAGYPGLLASLVGPAIGLLGEIPFAEETADALSKWRKKSHAIAYFDVQRSLERVESLG